MKKIFRLTALTIVALMLSFSAFAISHHIIASTPTTPTTQTDKFTPDQVQQIHQIIHNYLVKNPEVLVEASRALQIQQQKAQQASAMSAIKSNKMSLFDDPNSPTVGNKNAQATLIEFFDYQCGHCKQMAPIIKQIMSSDKNVRFVFKELPIFGGMSQYAAKAALASMKQGKYIQFHNLLFSANGPLTKVKIMKLAKKAGLNTRKLKRDMKSPSVEKQLQSNFQLARELKIMGTPTFVIGNQALTKFQYIPGATSLQNLQQQIESVE